LQADLRTPLDGCRCPTVAAWWWLGIWRGADWNPPRHSAHPCFANLQPRCADGLGYRHLILDPLDRAVTHAHHLRHLDDAVTFGQLGSRQGSSRQPAVLTLLAPM